MIFDLQSMFSDQQAVTATAASTNVIDLGVAQTPQHAKAAITRDVGRGRPIPVVVQVTEDFDALTSLTVALEVDDDEDFGTAEVVQSVVVVLADLVAGKRIAPFYLPKGTDKQYARMNYTVTGDNATVGKITAGLVFGEGDWSA